MATPTHLVRVIPVSTEAPVSPKAEAARASLESWTAAVAVVAARGEGRGGAGATAYAWEMCAQNSTAMPSAMARLTSETALSCMSARCMAPRRWTRREARTPVVRALPQRLEVRSQLTRKIRRRGRTSWREVGGGGV